MDYELITGISPYKRELPHPPHWMRRGLWVGLWPGGRLDTWSFKAVDVENQLLTLPLEVSLLTTIEVYHEFLISVLELDSGLRLSPERKLVIIEDDVAKLLIAWRL